MTDLASMISNCRPSASGGMLDGSAITEGSAFFPAGDYPKGGTEFDRNVTVANRAGGLEAYTFPKDSTERHSPSIRSIAARWGVSRSHDFAFPAISRTARAVWMRQG